MFAVYATHAAPNDPLAALKIGERPEPEVPEGWVRVKVSHASLNRHDLFTLRGMSGHPEGITYPIILSNDGAGTLDDGTPVVIYPVMGSDDWRGDETLDPRSLSTIRTSGVSACFRGGLAQKLSLHIRRESMAPGVQSGTITDLLVGRVLGRKTRRSPGEVRWDTVCSPLVKPDRVASRISESM